MTDLEKATEFLRGVVKGDTDLATRHVDPDAFLDHGASAEDAIALWRRIDDLSATDAEVAVVRTVVDPPFVVVQHDGGERGHRVAFDVFRFDGGMIVEHWGFAAPDGVPNRSGHTQVDGPTEPHRREETERNKATIRDYYETVHLGGDHEAARCWFPEHGVMIRHEPGVADDGEAFLRDLALLTQDRTIDAIELMAGEGDFVFLVARGTFQSEPCAYVDLYRVDEEKIVEHWGFPERV